MGSCSGKIAFGKHIKPVLPRKLGTIGWIRDGLGVLWSLPDSSTLLLLPSPQFFLAWVLPQTAALQGQLFMGAAVLQDKLGQEHTLHGPHSSLRGYQTAGYFLNVPHKP